MNSYFVELKKGGSFMVRADEFKIGGPTAADSLYFKSNGSIVMLILVEYVFQVLLLDENNNYVKVF